MPLVQATPKVQILNTFEYNLVFDDPVTAGSTIIVLAGVWSAQGGDFATPTDTLSNSYTLAVKSGLGAVVDAEGLRAGIFYSENVLGGANTVNLPTVQGNDYGQAIALEWSGLTVSSLDKTVSSAFTRAGSSQQAATGNTAALAQNDELIVAVMSLYEFDSAMGIGPDAATGFTGLYREQDADANIAGGADYKVVASTAAQSATWAHDPITSDTKGWATALATFKIAASGGPLTTSMINSYIAERSRSHLRR